ncbi:hypothetical protein HU200_064906 [Digitaria exilis]|uniref:L-ascorbate oxidase n=1 Tax=Digitaria exilis TaxID=1010633 RepID=A0A835DXX8_9POAL|nr:hypothetical protein HU200_064906 [Digitaria exilis]
MVCCALLAFASPPHCAEAAKARHFKWEISNMFWSPDCEEKVVIGINGQFPGPTIRARAGDTIHVELKNALHTEGVVIHWHGIRQIGTPWADGTASISQCPINPGESFTYRFTVDKAGTFFYHGHFGMQRAAGLYGSLIVDVAEGEEEPFKYDGELNLLLSDWYHEAVYAQAAGLERKDDHFQWVGEPQTVLINGRGQFGCTLGDVGDFQREIQRDAKAAVCEDEKKTNCSMILRSECGPFCRDTQCGPVVFDVQPGKTYRLRIASTTSLSALNVQVEGHDVTVVEADGNLVEPFDVSNLDIYSGESYSVLLKTLKEGESPYWISVGVIGREPKTLPALAVLRYVAGSTAQSSSSSLPTTAPPETPTWNDVERSRDFAKKLKARAGAEKPMPTNRRIDMLNIQDMVDGQIKWAINHVSLELPATPYLGAYLYNIQDQVFNTTVLPDTFKSGYDIDKPPQEQPEGVPTNATVVSSQVYTFKHGEVVDVVLQNADMRKDDTSESHPWHLHGHDFWVLGYGKGAYSVDATDPPLNVEDPPLRNTVVLFPHGWTAIRFVADNPGVWAFHCHIEPHLHMGMGVVLAEGMEDGKKLEELRKKVPKEAMMCGKTADDAALAARPITPATPPPPSP